MTAVAGHMNDDHREDNLLIVRRLGGAPGAVSARMTGMDADGLVFEVRDAAGLEQEARVPWLTVPTDRAQVRVQVVALHAAAAAASGDE